MESYRTIDKATETQKLRCINVEDLDPSPHLTCKPNQAYPRKNPLDHENPMSTLSTVEPTEIWGWVDNKRLYQALVRHAKGSMRHKNETLNNNS